MKWVVVGKDDPLVVSGGLNRFAEGYTTGLRATGHEVEWLISGAAQTPNATSVASGGMAKRMLNFFIAGFTMPVDVDVVDSHFAMYGAPYLMGMRAGSLFRRRRSDRTRRPKVLVHFQGPWAQESVVAGQKVGLVTRLKSWLEKSALTKAEAVVVLSDGFVSVAHAMGAAVPDITIIEPGINDEWFSEQNRSKGTEAHSKIEMLCVRRLTARMGHLEFLESLERLDFHLADAPIRLHLVGIGEQGPAIETWIASHGRERSVLLHGRLDDGALRRLGGSCTVAVVPTLQLEGYGLVVLEAMAMGLPVLSTGQGGLRAAMGPWAQGDLVFELESTESVARAIAEAHRMSQSADEIGGLIAFAKAHSWSDVAAQTAELVGDVSPAGVSSLQ